MVLSVQTLWHDETFHHHHHHMSLWLQMGVAIAILVCLVCVLLTSLLSFSSVMYTLIN